MDPMLMVALAVFGLAVLYVLFTHRGGAAGQVLPSARKPGRLLIDHFEEAGKEAAGKVLEATLGQQKAAEIGRSFAAAFSPPAAPSSPPPATPPTDPKS